MSEPAIDTAAPVPISDELNFQKREVPLATRVVRGGTFVALTAYGLTLFGFVSNLFLTRWLDPADFGIVALGVLFFLLIKIRPKLGVLTAMPPRPTTNTQTTGTN